MRVTYTDQLGGVETNRASAPTPLISSASNNPGVLSISGTPTQNQLLTALVTDADGVPGSVSYQWQQSSNGTSWTNIGGATANTLTLQQAQVGSFVRATASYVDVLGSSENVTGPATPSTIANVNDAPVLAVQTGNQNAVVGSAFSLALPAGTFTDVDAGDTLTYTATAADGSALPAWLTFNAATRTFSGTPAAANVGTQVVKVSATDLGGLAASETFNIAVTTTPEHRRRRRSPTRAMPRKRAELPTARAARPPAAMCSTNDTDPDAGDTKTVTAVKFGAVNGTLGTALTGAHGSLVLNAAGVYTYTVNETDAAVQALRQSTDTRDRCLQLHHARHGRRHLVDDAHGQHSRRQRRTGARRPDRQPERDRRLGLLPGAARRYLHRCRCRRHSRLHGNPTARRFPHG